MSPVPAPPPPRLTVRQRWLAARRLAAGDTPRVAAAFAGAEAEDLAATDPRFMALLDDAKALRALSREAWRERVEGLLRDHVEDAIAEGRVTTTNLGPRSPRLLRTGRRTTIPRPRRRSCSMARAIRPARQARAVPVGGEAGAGVAGALRGGRRGAAPDPVHVQGGAAVGIVDQGREVQDC